MTEEHGQDPLEPDADAPEREGALAQLETRLNDFAERFDKTDWVELVAAVVLAMATILAAWSAYQSARWSGEQTAATNTANAQRLSAIGLVGAAGTQASIDSQLVIAWMQSAIDGDEQGMAEFEARMRDALRPAFDAWLATAPPGEIPPGSPLDLPEYEEEASEALDVAREAIEGANESMVRAAEANQRSDNFVLVAVVMAAVLFFAGVGSKFRGPRLRVAMVLVAMIVLLVGFGFMVSMPQSVGF